MKIPFNKLYNTSRDVELARECIKKGFMAGNGEYTQKVHELIESKFSCPKVFLTTSGTSALEMAAILLDLATGDEVIMPSFTFVSTANAMMLRGARPVFAEIQKDTLNIDPADIEVRITERTKAIIPVHYAGTACDMERIMEIARKNDLLVIEDAAQAVNALYGNRYLGTIGDIGCYSFHATKNYSCGEGGALLLNMDDPDIAEQASIIWEKGTNRSQFLRGEVDKYTWIRTGASYLIADVLAAFLYGQLLEMDRIKSMRERVYKNYYDSLWEYQQRGLIRLPVVPAGAEPNYHIFYLLFSISEHRDHVMGELKKRGIEAPFHYIPLHSSPMGKNLGYSEEDFPVTEVISRTLLLLPIYPHMKSAEQAYVVDNLRDILQGL